VLVVAAVDDVTVPTLMANLCRCPARRLRG
jgi:hypothetical protein